MNNATEGHFAEAFRNRTKKFALSVIKFTRVLPKVDEAVIIKRQLLRSATSVAANYRAATRARSKNEFYAKLCIVVEEADETLFWLELLEESNLVRHAEAEKIMQEASEILSIAATARKKARTKL